ncbi:hypothetical protein VNO78_34507 [Psophocarpus tetragonolobus]|uniref:Uncharacterized protein n=1 Tax=Psophocarpus tetragonolobus TaxID=3891 RepID=A0AAN9NP31_PSOTE
MELKSLSSKNDKSEYEWGEVGQNLAKVDLTNEQLLKMLVKSQLRCPLEVEIELNHPIEAASRGYSFIISFSKSLALREHILPFCMGEVWVITACLALIKATTFDYNSSGAEHRKGVLLSSGISLARVKFIRLAYLIGFSL